MKKFALILFALLVAVVTMAQDYTSSLDPGRTYREKSMSTVLTNTDTVDVVVNIGQHQKFTFDAGMVLDSISGDPSGTLYVLGRKADTEAWSAIANTAFSGADETTIVSQTTAVRYRQLMLRYISGGTGVTNANEWWLKLWLE